MAREAALNSCLVQSVLNSPHVPEHLLCYLYAKKNCFCATIQCREKFCVDLSNILILYGLHDMRLVIVLDFGYHNAHYSSLFLILKRK